MLGTIVNALSVLVGCAVGLAVKNFINEKIKSAVMTAIGLSVIFVGFNMTLTNMKDGDGLTFIISIAFGSVIGEIVDLDKKINSFGEFLKNKLAKNDAGFAKGFVNSSILFCVGTMSILGAIQSGAYGNHELLFAKSVLDGISAIIFASSFGIGAALSSVSILVYQGALTLCARAIEPYATPAILAEISTLGGIMVAAIGMEMAGILKIKVSNALPSLAVAVAIVALKSIIL
jgi:uncharacterized membrane protein YqgA involved in biofilm formation